MSKIFVLTTSGFVLPLTAHYTPVDQSKLDVVSIFGRSTPLPFDSNLAEFTKDVLEHHSPSANDAYRNYEANKSFENFMVMVDMTSEILSHVNVSDFMKIQAINRYLSPTSFRFCTDILSDRIRQNHRDYLVFPLNARFQDPGLTTPARLEDNQRTLNRYGDSLRSLTWENILPDMINDKNTFSAFFRYLFVDAY